MSDTAETLAVPLQLRVGGKVYFVSRLTRGIRAMFSEWHKGLVREELMGMRKYLDSRGHALVMKEFGTDCASGLYEFGKATSNEKLFSKDGMVYLFYLLLKDQQPKIEEEEVALLLDDYPDEVAEVVNEIFPRKKKVETPPQEKTA